MRSLTVRLACIVSIAAGLVFPGGHSTAGTCSVPITTYFFYGAPVPQGPGGRLLIPNVVDVGRQSCATGAPVDAFVVPPGVHFMRAELQTPISTPPGYCVQGLGIAVCGAAEPFISSATGQRYAKTDTHVLDPTAVSGGFSVSFDGYGVQTYRTVAG